MLPGAATDVFLKHKIGALAALVVYFVCGGSGNGHKHVLRRRFRAFNSRDVERPHTQRRRRP